MSNENAKKIAQYEVLIAKIKYEIASIKEHLQITRDNEKEAIDELASLSNARNLDQDKIDELEEELKEYTRLESELNSLLTKREKFLKDVTAELEKLQPLTTPTPSEATPPVVTPATPANGTAPSGATPANGPAPSGQSATSNSLLVLTMDVDNADKIDNKTIKYYKVDSTKKQLITEAITKSGATSTSLNLPTKGGKIQTRKAKKSLI